MTGKQMSAHQRYDQRNRLISVPILLSALRDFEKECYDKEQIPQNITLTWCRDQVNSKSLLVAWEVIQSRVKYLMMHNWPKVANEARDLIEDAGYTVHWCDAARSSWHYGFRIELLGQDHFIEIR